MIKAFAEPKHLNPEDRDSVFFRNVSLRLQDYTTKRQKKVKYPCLINEALCHEDIRGSAGIAPPLSILALDGGE
jgi:hypothetical protein